MVAEIEKGKQVYTVVDGDVTVLARKLGRKKEERLYALRTEDCKLLMVEFRQKPLGIVMKSNNPLTGTRYFYASDTKCGSYVAPASVAAAFATSENQKKKLIKEIEKM